MNIFTNKQRHSLRLEYYSHQASVVFKCTVVSICTNRLHIQNSAPFPQCFYILRLTPTIHTTYLPTRCEPTGVCKRHNVFGEVGTAPVHITEIKCKRTGRVAAQAVSHWLSTTEKQVRSQVSLCDIYDGQRGISPSPSTFPSHNHSTNAPILYKLLLPERQMGEAWEPSKRRCI